MTKPRPEIAIEIAYTVCQWEFLWRDVLQELIALVDDFDVDAITVAVGYPRQPDAKRHSAVALDRAQTAEWQQVHGHCL